MGYLNTLAPARDMVSANSIIMSELVLSIAENERNNTPKLT